MKLRVYHLPQIPCAPFHVPVATVAEAVLVLNTLANYDLFQLKHRIKGDYANASGLDVWDEGEGGWVEWEGEEGESIDDVLRAQEEGPCDSRLR